MKSLFATLLPTLALSVPHLLDSVCVRDQGEAGPIPSFKLTNYRTESDATTIGLMGTTEKEYSVPYELIVCHDDTRIHGVQLTLTMHRFPFEGEDELAEEFEMKQLLFDLDKMIEESAPRRMTFIGTVNSNCETTKIYEKGFVKHLDVYSDNTGIIALQMEITNGRSYAYGKPDVSMLEHTRFDFEDGKQLLGLYGKVIFDQNEEFPDDLLTLGVFKDDCSATRTLYMNVVERNEAFRERHGRRGDGFRFGAMFAVGFVISVVLCAIYACLKHRGKICKRNSASHSAGEAGEAGQAELPERENAQPVSDLDRTPAKVAVQAEAINEVRTSYV